MPLVGKIDLRVCRDVKIGEEVSIFELFGEEELKKEFTVESDVELDKTKLKVTVDNLGSIECVADAFKKKGSKTSLWNIMKYRDMSVKMKVEQEIKKDDVLSIIVETI
ncbi:MAG: hypothetical protein QW655_01825 [Nitrososphaerota archaeon]|nr:hypothetical protein [Candidatus Geocrenenecus dongiae]